MQMMDQRVAETYAKDSAATNKNALSDPYVKAFRWASDRIARNGEGIVAFVSNNSFLEELAFDGMRKNLAQDFDRDLYAGPERQCAQKSRNSRAQRTTVFGIQVGVCIHLSGAQKGSNDLGSLRARQGFSMPAPAKSGARKKSTTS